MTVKMIFANEQDLQVAKDIHWKQLQRRNYQPPPDVELWLTEEDVAEVRQGLIEKDVEFREEQFD